ncbi:MAG: hypothetical protein F6K42_14995 [Leptolyngbya sp. SIO1D8]|nr:hypothetical protein [Leptolyngbya sp. SIO1D8]
MMDSDPKNYPSRMFIRFTARNQLTADATGRPIAAMVQRFGGEAYVQRMIPENESSSSSVAEGGFSEDLGLEFSMDSIPSGDPTDHPLENNQAHVTPDKAPQVETDNTAVVPNADCCIDDALFSEIVKTTFNHSRYPELFQSCGTSQAAREVEAKVAADIIASYRQIKRRQSSPVVQGLNKLL